MSALFEAPGGVTLSLPPPRVDAAGYPTSRICRGLIMSAGTVDLSEEGVGFGVPVVKEHRETVFPGTLRVRNLGGSLLAEYHMNLVERLSLRSRSRVGAALNLVREPLALLHRRYPLLRGALTLISNVMRAAFGIRTQFQSTSSRGIIKVTYCFDTAAGRLRVRVDAQGLHAVRCTELVMMNELGAHFFDRYTDDTGCRKDGNAIETWQEVTAARASFIDTGHGVAFATRRIAGARLMRGRELVEGRLAWAGLSHVLPPDTRQFGYDLDVGAAP